MRTPSMSFISLAALAASLAEGAAIPSEPTSGSASAASSRRSSIQSGTATSQSSLSTTSTTTTTSSTISSTTKAAVAGRPVVVTQNQQQPATTSTRSSSLSSSQSLSFTTSPTQIINARPVVTTVAPAAGRPVVVTGTSKAATLTSSSSTDYASVASVPSQVLAERPASSDTGSSSSLFSPTFSMASPSSTLSSSSSTLLPSSSSSDRLTSQSSIKATSTSTTTSSLLASSSSLASSSPSSSFSSSSSSSYSTSSTFSYSSSRRTSATSLSSSIYVQSSSGSTLASLSSRRTSATATYAPSSSSPLKSSFVTSSTSSSPSASSSAVTSTMRVSSMSGAASSRRASSTLVTQPSSVSKSAVRSASVSAASASAPATVPQAPSYIDLGCWYDTSSNRTLTGPSYVDSTGMTNEKCSVFCTKNGMAYSGTEYGEECYCSSTAPTSAPAWWCNMPCPGDSTEVCGSGNALSVTLAVQPQPAMETTSLGCFADSSTIRTMTGPNFTSDSMTNEMCSAFCTAQRYAYSGTEYASQCFCSNEAPWSAQVGCSMPCAGDSTEICGDGNALAVTLATNSSAATTKMTTSSTTQISSAASASASSSLSASGNSTRLGTAVDLGAKFSSWTTWKARGVNIGNWLVLEEWMDPSWFNANAPQASDEWTFCQSLGQTACTKVLQDHWSTFITEPDIAKMASMNTNTLRIPIGFWAFIDPLASEPYVRSTQLAVLSRVLGYAETYGMTVVLDIHGLPGSQNGKDHSGHAGSVDFYHSENQARSLATVQAAATWLAGSGFAGSVVSALEVANEPAIADWSTWLQYKDYVLAAHAIVQSTVPSVTTMFHDGFWDMTPWNKFFSAADNVVIDTHKYWAFTPTTATQAISDVCSYVETFADINVPVFIGEFSLSIDDATLAASGENSFATIFFQSQMAAWLQSAGAAFWSIKVFNQDGVTQNSAWSAEGLLQTGLLGTNPWALKQSQC